MIREFMVTILSVIMMLFVSFGLIWFAADQEAKAYRKFCDRDVTTWDAIWLDLRIDECDNK